LSYTVSKLGQFFETQCSTSTAVTGQREHSRTSIGNRGNEPIKHDFVDGAARMKALRPAMITRTDEHDRVLRSMTFLVAVLSRNIRHKNESSLLVVYLKPIGFNFFSFYFSMPRSYAFVNLLSSETVANVSG